MITLCTLVEVLSMNLYRVFGNNLPTVFIRANDAEDALHKGRTIHKDYTAVQRIDDTVKKVYNLDIKEEDIIE